MDTKDIRSFVEIENDLHLFERSYNGFHYWQYLRFAVCESLFGDNYRINNIVRENIKRNKLKLLIHSINDSFKDILIYFSLKHADLVQFRQVYLKEKFFNTWELPDGVSTYIFRTRDEEGIDTAKDNHFGIPKLCMNIKMRLLHIRNDWKIDNEEHKFLVELEKIYLSKFGQCVPCGDMETSIKEAYYTHKFYKKYFDKVFRKLGCKAILTIVYYQDYLYPAYEVAKEMGIPIIELQHGVVNNHEAYWFKDKRGINNYTPDYLLTYGDIHSEWVNLVEGCSPISIGFPYQEKMVRDLLDVVPKEDVVMVYPESNSILERIIDEFANQYPQYRVIVKMHPLQAYHEKEYYPILSNNPSIKFINSQDKGIYYWLKYAKHHVMANTTVGLEAMAFDHCNVCVIENIPHDQTQCLLDWGVARGFKSTSELAKLIENPLEERDNLFDVRNRLWKRNAKVNIEQFFMTMSENGWKYQQNE